MVRPSGWDVLGLDGDPTPGAVESVLALAKEFGDFAHDVQSAWRSLTSFGSDTTALQWIGSTADAFKSNFGPLPGRLQKLWTSYSEASDALSAYAPKLLAAQNKADAALSQAQDAHTDLQRATTSADSAASDLKTAQQNQVAAPNPQAVTDAQSAHDAAQKSLAAAKGRLDTLTAQAKQAEADRVAAAKECAKALHHAQSDGIHNKHWWQHVGAALSDWGGKIAEVAGDIAPVLDTLAMATAWIPGVDVVTATLAKADNTVAMVGTAMEIAGDTMQGHYHDALMNAGMLGVTALGAKGVSKLGGKGIEALSSKVGKDAEHGAENAANAGERDAVAAGADSAEAGANTIGEDVRGAEGGQDANVHRDPVDVVSGWMLTDATDVDLPGVLPLVLRRAYASGYATGRLFGPGWASTLDQRLSINAAGIHFAGDDTQRLDYPIPDTGQEVLPRRGARWPLIWDRDTDEIRITDPWSGLTWHFTTVHYSDDTGQIRDLTTITDRNSNRINILRDAHGTPTAVEHPGYRIAVDTMPTAAGPRITALHLHDSTTGTDTTLKQFRYDQQGRLTGVVNSSDLPFTYEWNNENRISAWQDRSGYRYEYTYDHLGRVTRGDGAFLSGTFEYDPANRTTIITNSLGHATTVVYDEHGHVCSETDPLGNTIVSAHDRYGYALSHIDALGGSTVFERDEAGDIRRIVDPDGAETLLEYNNLHQLLKATRPDGAIWHRRYDDRGNLVSTTDPTGATTAFEYDSSGAVIAVRDPLDAVTRYTTNAAGLITGTLDPVGSLTQTLLNAAGQVVQMTDPLGAMTTMEWTPEGLPISRTDADGAVTRWEYDADGSLLKILNPYGAATTFELGPLGTLAARTGPDGIRHTFTYDGELRLQSVTNVVGATWTYVYDPGGRLVEETDFNGRALGYAYDHAGRLIGRTTATGQHITLQRDRLGRVTARSTPEGEHTYSYDAVGRLRDAQSPGVTAAFEYDAVGRLLAETINGRTTRQAFDLTGRLTTRRTASGIESTWDYDAAGLPVRLTNLSGRLDFSFDAAGREVQRALGETALLTHETDAMGRIIAQQLVAGDLCSSRQPRSPVDRPDPGAAPDLIFSRAWLRRADGAIEEIRDSTRGNRHISSDALGRPLTVAAQGWSETYSYDAFGNVLMSSGTEAADNAAQAPVTAGTLVRRSGRTHYSYDDAGRLVRAVRRTLDGRRRTWLYGWDSEDRLVQASTPDNGTWHYTYDPMGRRIGKHRVGVDGEITEQTFFTWQGSRLAEENAVGQDGTITTVAWDYEPRSYRPAAQRCRRSHGDLDQPDVDEAFYAIVTDLIGTPTELVASDGHVAWRATTSAWGRTVSTPVDPEAACSLRFPGQYYDAETGLHYNLYRYYNPDTASYLTPDPLGLAPSPNDHAYVPNPFVFSDPLGLSYEQQSAGPGRDLIDGQAQLHIIAGDRTGGGHKWPGMPGKTVFPESWDTDKILDGIADVATNPKSNWEWQTGKPGSLFTKSGKISRVAITGMANGVKIKIIYEPATDRIITGYPLQS